MNIFIILILLHSGELYVAKPEGEMTKEKCQLIAHSIVIKEPMLVKSVACIVDSRKEV